MESMDSQYSDSTKFNQRLCIGTWEGSVVCYEFLTGNKIWEIEPKNEVRIKSVAVSGNWLVVGNSEGNIFVYAMKKDKKPKEKASVASSCRITCLVLSRLLSDEELKETKKKRKKKKLRKRPDGEGETAGLEASVELKTPKIKKSGKTVGTPQQQWEVTPVTAGT